MKIKIKIGLCYLGLFLFIFTNCLMAQWNTTSPYEVYVNSNTRTLPTNPALPEEYENYNWSVLAVTDVGSNTLAFTSPFFGIHADCISVDFPQGLDIGGNPKYYEYTGGFFQAGSDPVNVVEDDLIGSYMGSQSLARIYVNDKDFENGAIVGSQSKATFENPGRKSAADLLIGTIGHVWVLGGAVLEVSPDVKYDGEMQDNITEDVFGVQANVGLAAHDCSSENTNTHIGVNAGNVYAGVFNVASIFGNRTTLDEIEIDNLYGVKINFDDYSTSGVLSNDTITSVTNAYGLYVEDPADTFDGTINGYSTGIYSEGDIVTEKDLFVGSGLDSDNDYVYYDQGSESVKWDNTNGRFEVSDDLKVTTGDISVDNGKKVILNSSTNSTYLQTTGYPTAGMQLVVNGITLASFIESISGYSGNIIFYSKNVYVEKGLHVGNTSGDPGNDNLLVDGNTTVSGKLIISSSTPASAGATGTAGTITYDSNFMYICVATNSWKRVAIAAW